MDSGKYIFIETTPEMAVQLSLEFHGSVVVPQHEKAKKWFHFFKRKISIKSEKKRVYNIGDNLLKSFKYAVIHNCKIILFPQKQSDYQLIERHCKSIREMRLIDSILKDNKVEFIQNFIDNEGKAAREIIFAVNEEKRFKKLFDLFPEANFIIENKDFLTPTLVGAKNIKIIDELSGFLSNYIINLQLIESPSDIILKNMVVYIGNENDYSIREFINNNYDKISNELSGKGLIFIYYPRITDKELKLLSDIICPILQYNIPEGNWERRFEDILKSFSAEDFYEFFLNILQIDSAGKAGFIKSFYDIDFCKRNEYHFLKFNLILELNWQIEYFISAMRAAQNIEGVMFWDRNIHFDVAYKTKSSNNENNPEEQFEKELNQLTEKIRARLILLSKESQREALISLLSRIDNEISAFNPEKIVSVSRLVIDKHYKIFLPDYNNLEIEMTPLPKTLFLFYLNHPEGLMLSHLVNYKDELSDLYYRVTNSSDNSEIQKRIEDLVDVTKNSVNEKCSRIKEAFITRIDDSLARNYYVTGKRGEPKRIVLDRNFMELNL